MNLLENAMGLAAKGYRVFPLVPNSKVPLIDDFPNEATTDENKIKRWWLDPILETVKPYNVGISTDDLLVIDVDNKDGHDTGSKSLETLAAEGRDIPDTYTQQTPTGGLHIVYRTDVPLKQGINKLGAKLDTRGKGGYIVGAGSVIDGQKYTVIKDVPAVSIPPWLAAESQKAPEKRASDGPIIQTDNSLARDRAIFYLENEAPESVKGDGGDNTAYTVAAKVKDFGVSETDCLDLMMEHWYEGSGWDPEKLKIKIANAYRYGQEVQGSLSPEASFTPVEVPEGEKSYLQKINDEFAIVYLEGNHYVIHETVDAKGLPARKFLTEQTFKRMFSPFKVAQESGAPKTYAAVWLDWKGRREYKGVTFSPEKATKHEHYNLWRGYTVEPLAYEDANAAQREGFDMFKSHVFENVCSGIQDHYNWVMGFFAHMIQKPYERPRTTLVFRGEKGVGKNAMVDRIGALLGRGHYLVAHDSRYLTSNFNGHMDSCLMLVLDEAFWSGDKGAEGKLKGLTTSPEIMIERKGKEPYLVDNLARFVIIGNEDWLVPASHDERRYGVFDVGSGKKQNIQFFTKMRELIDNEGGNRVLLHYLKNFDLSCTNLDVIPKTEALLDQKTSSLHIVHMWWRECLVEGRLVGAEFAENWEQDISTDRFRHALRAYVRDEIGAKSWMPDQRAIGKMMKQCCPLIARRNVMRERKITKHYRIPDLDTCRADWDKFMGQKTNWENA